MGRAPGSRERLPLELSFAVKAGKNLAAYQALILRVWQNGLFDVNLNNMWLKPINALGKH